MGVTFTDLVIALFCGVAGAVFATLVERLVK